jgi:threonine dehydrogenase-like Zn-dependent dehydrogenase
LRALHFDGVPRLREDLPLPEPGPGEARLKVRLAGICRTDVEITRGYVPFTGVLGHEFVATVDSALGGQGLEGRRVVGEINCPCGECDLCRRGEEGRRHCPRRTVLGIEGRDGCLAEYCCLPIGNLHRVPDAVPDESAVFAEPLAAALRIAEQVDLRGDERALVLGDGKLGLLCAMVLAGRAGELVIAGRHEEKLSIARAGGARAVVADELDDSGFDLVVEATGRAEGVRLALARARPLGTVVLKSTVAGEQSFPLAAAVVNEVTLVGSRCGPFGPALEALTEGSIDPRPMISARYPLEEAEKALRRAAEPGVLKVLVEA